MGALIAQGYPVAGLSVVIIDVDAERIARARNAISDGIDRLSKKAAPPAGDRSAASRPLRGVTDYEARDCDKIVLAATENEAPKVAIMPHVNAVVPDDAIAATITFSRHLP